MYTVFRKKHPLTFLLYLRGICLDLHKIFRVCLWGIRYSKNIKIKYSLLPMTILTPCLHVCKIMGFTIEDKHLIKCLRVSNEYLILTSMECLISHKQTLKILYKSKHFHRDIKENASGCFFCLKIRQKHPLAFSFISRWKMFRFVQNYQGMFVRN